MTLDEHLFSTTATYKLGIPTELYDPRIPNLTQEIINKIANKIKLPFILAKDHESNVCMANSKEVRSEFRETFDPIDILDYVYAILHSSKFHSTDKKSLKTNFPYPRNAEIFWKLAEIGSQIKEIHSLKTPKTGNLNSYDQKITLALSETDKLVQKIDELKD